MAQVRFQRTLCFTAVAMAAFVGLVALWPFAWRRLATGDWSDWRSVAGMEILFQGPAVSIVVLRASGLARVIAGLLLLCSVGFAGRLYYIMTDPLFDRNMLFIKMDPFLAFYGLMFGVGGWVVALLAAPFVLWRRDGPKNTDRRDA